MSEKSLIKAESGLKNQIKECKKEVGGIFTLISDSKGKSLERASYSIGNIVPICSKWWCKSGAKSKDTLNWIKVRSESDEIDENHTIFVWLGTCDLTSKGKNGEIRLNDRTNSAADQLINNYKQLVQILGLKTSKIIILELPYYSISIWNSKKTKTSKDIYTEEDKLLKNQIDYVNENIHQLNQERNVQAPYLNKDLLKYRSGGKKKKTSQYINWTHLPDGIHPAPLISRIWVLKLILCYHRS